MAAYHKVEVALNKQSITVGAPSPQTVTVVVPNRGPKGDTGETGPTGPANSLSIGTVTTGAAGSSASAIITGTAPDQTLDLAIPRGDKGEKGDTGDTGATGATGPANTLTIGTVTTGAEGAPAAATITGDAPNQTLSLTLPVGATGATGPQGPAGEQTTDASLLTSGTLADARLSANVALKDAANTFTANQTLNGTNNVAPNQTAASGSSIMTRDLVREESFFLVGSNFFPRSFLYGSAGAGSSAQAFNGDIRIAGMASGTATSGFGRITITRGINTTVGYSGGGIRFGSFIIGAAVRFVTPWVSTTGALDNRIRFIVGGNGGTPATADSDPLGVVGFGWEIRSVSGGMEWRVFAHNGTNFSGGAWQAGYQGGGLGVPLYLSVVSNGAGQITGFFGIEGSRTLNTATITGGPTSNGNSTNSYVDFVAVNSSGGTPVSAAAGLSEVQILCLPS